MIVSGLCVLSEPVLNLLNMLYAIPIVYCLLSAVQSQRVSRVQGTLIEVDQGATCSVIHLDKLPHAAFQGCRLYLPR